MTVSVGSYHDLEPNQEQPLERSPSVPCHVCKSKYDYKDYWEGRYVEGKSWNPAEICWVCDDCIDTAKDEYDLHKTKNKHKQLTEYL